MVEFKTFFFTIAKLEEEIERGIAKFWYDVLTADGNTTAKERALKFGPEYKQDYLQFAKLLKMSLCGTSSNAIAESIFSRLKDNCCFIRV